MDITKYIDYFHDGCVIDISHQKNSIEFFLESSQCESQEIPSQLLSSSKTLKGKLCLKKIKKIIANDKPYHETLTKKHDSGEILELEIANNKLLLLIQWTNYPPKQDTSDVSKIEIEAEEVHWENIPTLKTD